jgi:hypothetical protein
MAAVKSQDWKDGFNHAMSIMSFWLEFEPDEGMKINISNVGMRKSEFLGRLARGEEVRRRPCPKHKGKMWCAWGMHDDYSCCQGTGWLPNEEVKPDVAKDI